MITCTNQPRFFNNLLRNYRRQRYKHKELIVILNKDGVSLRDWRRKAARYANVRVYQVPERISLGQCLNCGISVARYPLLAKFDHDDYYAPYYLQEQVKALRRTGSAVVGKHACLVYLAASRKLIIRSPQERSRRVGFVQGGTILFRRKVLRQARFPDLSLGEDVKFLRDCTRKGLVIHATTPYNYVYVRRKNKRTHTWRVGDHRFLPGSIPVAVTGNFRRYAGRKP
ncbi:glycosyltransferase family 2 protein [Paenibacillus sp. IB182496]|uniref:Glycosyltransferase family 2 protein n=2 Tax=Paenibacillus sabuli TaxID=2772509 RepID=A0A927BQJ9_9BACL|nr:glycosyltransferase family 2 protein [Paenibacillus sabuli]